MSDIKITIGGDVRDLQQELAKGEKSLFLLKEKAMSLESALFTEKSKTKIRDYNQQLVVVRGEMDKLKTAGTNSFGGIGNAANSAFSSIRKIAYILPGIGIAGIFSLLAEGAVAAATEIFKLSESIDRTKISQEHLNTVLSGAENSYVKAVTDVSNLRIAFEQARNGIITKNEALKLYNDTIGKTTGFVTNLDDAEKALAKNATAYVQFTLLKAAANIALQESAKKAFEAIVAGKNVDEVVYNRKFTTGVFGKSAAEQREAAAIEYQKQKKEALKQQQDFLNIQKEFQDKAELLAKEFKLDFNGIKEVTVKPKKIKIIPAGRGFDNIEISGGAPDIEIKAHLAIDEGDAASGKQIGGGGAAGAIADRLIGGGVDDVTKEAQAKMDAIQLALAKMIESTAENLAIGVGEAIGNALGGGRDVIPNLFGGLMQNVGEQVQDLGKYLIKLGIKMEVAKKALAALFKSPAAQIAAGIGLVALGALLKAQVQKKYNGFASGTTGVQQGGFYDVGERGRERVFLPAGSAVQPNNEVNAFGGGGITLMPSIEYNGTNFRIFLNRVDAQMGRNG